MDFETFGEHQWKETGIFEFLHFFPQEALKHKNLGFATATEIVDSFPALEEFDVPYYSSWADIDRNLSAWLENKMQLNAFNELKLLEKRILFSKNKKLIDSWRKLQISDHFYYMCTKWFADGDVHKYFNPFDSPYDAFLSYMNILTDLKNQLKGGRKK